MTEQESQELYRSNAIAVMLGIAERFGFTVKESNMPDIAKRKEEIEDNVMQLLANFEQETGQSIKQVVLKKGITKVKIELEAIPGDASPKGEQQ